MAMLDPIADWLLRRDGRDRSSRDIAEDIGRGATDLSFLSEPPPPAAAATPNFDLTRPHLPPAPAGTGAPVMLPPAQEFGSPMLAQGFGNESPVAAALAPPSAAPAAPSAPPGRPAPDPPWLGMLNVSNPNAAPAGWAAPPQAAPSNSAAAPPPSAPAAPSKDQSPAVPESSLLGRLFNGFNDWRKDNRLTLMALGAGMAGAQNLGQGLNRGMTMAVPAMQADIKQQQLNSTIPVLRDRLMKSGLSADDATKTAMAAVGNPAIMAQMVPGLFGAKQRKFTQIGEDMLGNKSFGFADEVSGKVYGLDGKEIGAAGGGGATIPNGPDGQPLSGQPLLAYLEKNHPIEAAGVKGLIAGDLNAAGRNMQKLAPLASLVDSTFDMGVFKARQDLRKGYLGGGKQFQETLALNTVGGHLGRLMDSADGLDNSNWKPINKIRNWYADTFTGSPALVKFRNDLVTTQNELAKAYHGGHVSDSAYNAFSKAINEAQTPAELKTAIGELSDLLQSKIGANEQGYRSGMAQGAALPAEYHAINEEAKHSFSRINDWAHGINPAPSAAPSAAAAPGGAPGAAPSGGVTTGAPPPGSSWQWTPQGLVPAAAPGRTSQAEPPMKGARLGFHPNGERGWFVDDPNRPGKYMHVMVG